MKQRKLCVQCGKPNFHDDHTYDHEFVKPAPQKRRPTPIVVRSEKMQDYYEAVRIPAVAAIQGAPCEARISDVVPVVWKCDGAAVDIHEIVSRSQAGSLPLAVELGTMNVCRKCHNWITEHPKEAKEMGFRMSRKDLGLGDQV